MSCEKWCAQVTMAPIRVENIPNTAEYLLVPLSKQSFHPVAATFWFLSPDICSSCSWTWCEWNLTEWTLFILTSLIQYVFEIHLYCCIHLFSLSLFCWVVFHFMNATICLSILPLMDIWSLPAPEFGFYEWSCYRQSYINLKSEINGS